MIARDVTAVVFAAVGLPEATKVVTLLWRNSNRFVRMHVAPPLRMPLSLGRLLELVCAAQRCVGVFDQTDTLVYANDLYRRLLHIPAGELACWKDTLGNDHLRQTGNRIATEDFEAWVPAASRRGRLPFRAFGPDLHGRWIHVAKTTLAKGSAMTPATYCCATSQARSQGLVRREDVADRWGGELLLLLRGIDADAAHDAVEHMLASVRDRVPQPHPQFRACRAQARRRGAVRGQGRGPRPIRVTR